MAADGTCFGFGEEAPQALETLYSKVICRRIEIETLLTLFGEKTSYSCPAIFVCGHTATGKSFVVQTLLKDLKVRSFSSKLTVC